MAMESSIFPVPSEIVIPPAAFLAAQGHLSFAGVIIAGTVGSYLGAAITYWISPVRRAAAHPALRPVFFCLRRKARARGTSGWLGTRAGGVFFARLLPVVRHLISIPAGIVRMDFGTFSLVTIIGSGDLVLRPGAPWGDGLTARSRICWRIRKRWCTSSRRNRLDRAGCQCVFAVLYLVTVASDEAKQCCAELSVQCVRTKLTRCHGSETGRRLISMETLRFAALARTTVDWPLALVAAL